MIGASSPELGKTEPGEGPDQPRRRRKWTWWIVAGFAWLAVVYPLTHAAIGIVLPEDRVTRKRFDRVKLGLSLAETETLLGGPADYEGRVIGRVVTPEEFFFGGGEGGSEYIFRQWNSPETSAVVLFGQDGRVACRYTGLGQRVPLVDRLSRLRSGSKQIP